MPTATHNRRLQPRWTLVADLAAVVLWRATSAAPTMRGGAWTMAFRNSIDGASAPGWARAGRDPP